MKIGYLGDGPWSHRAFERIRAHADWEIVFIGARFVSPDPHLRAAAQTLEVPFFTPEKINDPSVLDQFRALKPDVIVSMSYDQIMRRALIDLAPRGLINVHAGALPFYRGRNVLNWALINGESRFGVTCHYVDEGIDTGDIIVQRFFPIGPDDDYGDVLRAAYPACADVLEEALERIASGDAPRIPQATIHPVGFYCGRRGAGDERIDWRWPAKRLHDFIRGVALPGPGARTTLDGSEIALLKTREIPAAPSYIGTPGEIVGRDAESVTVKCEDRTLRILLAAKIGADGKPGEPFAPKWRVGTRLGG